MKSILLITILCLVGCNIVDDAVDRAADERQMQIEQAVLLGAEDAFGNYEADMRLLLEDMLKQFKADLPELMDGVLREQRGIMINHLKNVIIEFNKQTNDVDRFKFIAQHPGIFTLMLDTDMTFPVVSEKIASQFPEEVEELPEINTFQGYLGWSDGVINLLEAIGMSWEMV